MQLTGVQWRNIAVDALIQMKLDSYKLKGR